MEQHGRAVLRVRQKRNFPSIKVSCSLLEWQTLCHGCPLYHSCPEFLQHDSNILHVVLQEGILKANQLSTTVLTSSDSDVWSIFSCQFHIDTKFLNAIYFDNVATVGLVLQDYPQLVSSQEFWTSVILSGNMSGDDPLSACLALALPVIRLDQNLMHLACQQDYRVYQTLNQ